MRWNGVYEKRETPRACPFEPPPPPPSHQPNHECGMEDLVEGLLARPAVTHLALLCGGGMPSQIGGAADNCEEGERRRLLLLLIGNSAGGQMRPGSGTDSAGGTN